VSFNYDTLLEDALESTVGLKIDGMSRYLSSDYLVAKLHGSINWIHRIKGPAIELSGMETDIASRVIDKAPQLDVNPPIDLAPHFPLARWGNDAIIPALSVPVATKSVYECPPEQQQALLEVLPDVDRVLMIGWKAREKRLLESMAELMKKESAHHDSLEQRREGVRARHQAPGRLGASWNARALYSREKRIQPSNNES